MATEVEEDRDTPRLLSSALLPLEISPSLSLFYKYVDYNFKNLFFSYGMVCLESEGGNFFYSLNEAVEHLGG